MTSSSNLRMSRRGKIRTIGTAAVIASLLFGSAPVLAQQDCPGANVVQAAAKSFIAAAQTHDPAQFANTVARYTDLTALALFALGPFRSELPPDRKGDYVGLVRAFIGRFLAEHAGSFANAQFQIQSCGDGEIRSTAGGEQIVWNVTGNRIRDVQAGGFSLAVELQSKFVSVIRQGGGDVDALFRFLGQGR